MAKKTFTVEVTETLQRQIEVKANSEIEAEQIVRDMYRREEIVLTSDDYIDTEFEVLSSKERIHGAIVEYGHTMEEYRRQYGNAYDNGDLWDYSREDLEDGSVEPEKNKVYWAIVNEDGEERLFETEN